MSLLPQSSQDASPVTRRIRRQFHARSRLPLHQDILWEIESGAVRSITWLEDGAVVSPGIWGCGDVVGRLLSCSNPYELECLTLVTVVSTSPSDVPGDLLIAHIHRLEELATIRSYRPMDVMLIKFLGWLAKQFGRVVNDGKLIDLRLTHKDIAELLGTTRVTVTRLLGQLEQQGLIQRHSMQKIVLAEEEFWYYQI